MVWAARGVRPPRVSAKRSWPPGCGRFPAAPETGGGEKGIIEGRAEEAAGHAVVSPAACNLPHTPPQPQPETSVVEDDARSSECRREGREIDATPLSFAATQICAANGSVDYGGDEADSLPTKGKEGEGIGQLFSLDGDRGAAAMATGNRAGDGESERTEGGGRRKKRWLMSLANLPPKKRAVAAMRRFPPGCGRPAIPGGTGEEGLVLEATPISFACEGASLLDPISPRHGFSEKMNGKRPLHQVKRAAAAPIARGGQVKRKCEGSSLEGSTPKTPVGGPVDVEKKGKRPESVKMNETLLDDAGVSGTRDKTPCTQRGVARLSIIINMKQDMLARKLKPGGKGQGSLDRLAQVSKPGDDDMDLGAKRVIVQALMAPDKYPLTRGMKSIARSLTPGNK